MRPRQLIAFICTLMAGAAFYTLLHLASIDTAAQARLAVQQLDPHAWTTPVEAGSSLPLLPGLIVCGLIAMAASLPVNHRRAA
jgi:hypothetical protein